MEVGAAGHGSSTTNCSALSRRPSRSLFLLRCPSLNSLRLRRIFDVFDKNGDGIITVNEMHQALNILGLEADLSELESTVRFYIQPGSPGLNFDDFLALHHSLGQTYFDDHEHQQELEESNSKVKNIVMQEREDAELSEAFKVFDEDGDGYISARELQAVLAKLGFSEGNEIDSCQKMILSVDRNHDGRVDFFEFKDMMRGVLVRA